MPKKGWKNMTVRESLYNQIVSEANEIKKSLSDTVQVIYDKYKEYKEG